MSRPANAIQQKKEQLREEADDRRQKFKEAKKELKGNPTLVEAVESLEDELDVIREAINL